MARVGISITKSTPFRNSTQEFSNVYYYEVLGLPTQAEANTMIDNLTAFEKTVHSANVTFLRGRCWSQTDNKATSEMIAQKNLTGTGGNATDASFDKERAFLVRLRAGNDSRGNPVYLRKWFHACGSFGTGMTAGSAEYANTSGFTQGVRDQIANKVGPIGDANGSPNAPKLCAKSGRLPTPGALWQAHQFLEHRQLGDQWRSN